MNLEHSARGSAEAVLFWMTPGLVDDLVNWETRVVADVAHGRMQEREHVETAVRFLRDVLTVSYVNAMAWELGCKTIRQAGARFDEIRVRAQALIGFDPLEQIESWTDEELGEHRPPGPRETDEPLMSIADVHAFVASVMANTDIEKLREKASRVGRSTEIDDLLTRATRYLRGSDAFLSKRLLVLAASGLGAAEIAKALGLDEPEVVGKLSKLHRVAPGALPAEELAAFDTFHLDRDAEAHMRWLESGAEGPDPCGGSR